MNRQQRRAMATWARDRGVVTLAGGPMDGWLVKADAPCLRPDWYRTWPDSVAQSYVPGHYALGAAGETAIWREG